MGPGCTTCRFVKIKPCSASTTKPVACDAPGDVVSKLRVALVRRLTMAGTQRSITACHRAASPSGLVLLLLLLLLLLLPLPSPSVAAPSFKESP